MRNPLLTIYCALFAVGLGLFEPRDLYAQRRNSAPRIQQTKPAPSLPSINTEPELKDAPTAKVERDFAEALVLIEMNYIDSKNLTYNDAIKSSIIGMSRSLDPHSNYYDREGFDELRGAQNSDYVGIGASLQNEIIRDKTNSYIVATAPNSPAARLGLRWGDKILSVDGEDMSGRSSSEVRDKIRGPRGSVVTIAVERAATLRTEILKISREPVPQSSIPYVYLIKGGVGYIDLTRGFAYKTADELQTALDNLNAQGMQSMILDLRNNAGGLLPDCLEVAEKFLTSDQIILIQKGRKGLGDKTYQSHNLKPDRTPLVILVNENTASAAEIVVGALQDHDRAVVVGNRTYGKGVMQGLFAMHYGTGLTLTTSRFYTPSGRLIQHDYTGGFYDYYMRGGLGIDQTDIAIKPTSTQRKTDSGRPIYEGGGISPDEYVSARTISPAQMRLRTSIFEFVRELISGRIVGFDADRTPSVIDFDHAKLESSDYPVTDELYNAFKEFVAKETRWSQIGHRLDQNRSFIQLEIRYNIILAAYGQAVANQVLTGDDPQVAKAIDMLPRAFAFTASIPSPKEISGLGSETGNPTRRSETEKTEIPAKRQDRISSTTNLPFTSCSTCQRRWQAYAKFLEGERYVSEFSNFGLTSKTVLSQAKQAFQAAAAFKPTLAEAHTALAELAFYYPPIDFDTSEREAKSSVTINPNNFGAHQLLSRLYTMKSGVKENGLNRSYADLAIKELTEVTRLDKNSVEAWGLLGELYLATGRQKEAIDAFSRSAAAPPSVDTRFFQYITGRELTPGTAHARLSEVLLQAGRTNEALAAIRRAIAIEPDNSRDLETLYKILQLGAFSDLEIIDDLTRVVTNIPNNRDAIIMLTRAQARLGRTEDALKRLRAAISALKTESHDSLILQLEVAETLAYASRYADAIDVCEQLLKSRGISDATLTDHATLSFASSILWKVIELHKRAGQVNEALATVERMRRVLGSDVPSADIAQVRLLRSLGRREDALKAAGEARQRFPQEAALRSLEFTTLAEIGSVDEAIQRWKANDDRDDYNLYINLCSILTSVRREKEAIEYGNKALKLASADPPDEEIGALLVLASALEGAGDPKSSEETLRKVLNKQPENATALNDLGYFLSGRNERLTEALDIIQRAVRAEPDNASFLDSLGWVYFKLNELDLAIRHLADAAQRNPDSLTTKEHLGDAYQKNGDVILAKKNWNDALRLATQPSDTIRIKTKLEQEN